MYQPAPSDLTLAAVPSTHDAAAPLEVPSTSAPVESVIASTDPAEDVGAMECFNCKTRELTVPRPCPRLQ